MSLRTAPTVLTGRLSTSSRRLFSTGTGQASAEQNPERTARSDGQLTGNSQTASNDNTAAGSNKKKKKKTLAELDEELRLAMEGHSGDGGAAGAELEGGKAVGLKRGVRENMFRYI